MRFLWLSAVKDLRLYARDSTALALWFVLPLVMAAMIGLVFGRGGGTPHGSLLVADEDGRLTGLFLREAVSRGPMGRMLTIENVDAEAGRQRLAHGDGSALVIIPKGFDRAVRAGETAQLTLVANPEQYFLPAAVREAALATVSAAHYAQQFKVADEDVMRSGAGLLQDPRITVNTVGVGKNLGRRKSVAEILFPGSVMLVALLMAAGMGTEIWREQRSGALRRVAVSDGGIGMFVGGKVAASSAVLMVALALAFAVERLGFAIPMRASGLALVWTICCAAAIYSGALALQVCLASERTATTVAAAVKIPLAMLGGSFFPFEAMPGNFVRIGKLTPNGWMVVKLREILTGPVAASELVREFAALFAASALLLWLVARQLRRRAVEW